ncbi:MAG: succinate dehydrogenase assembly factor 2 [Thiomonas sp.]|nr:succinate dehydrogenase assembly factor 2 [Thiomonas sp.]
MLHANAPAADAADLSRLRWRARRGMLENDLILQRYFAQCEAPMRVETVAALNVLLALDDNTLFDLFLRNTPLPEELNSPQVRDLLDTLQRL